LPKIAGVELDELLTPSGAASPALTTMATIADEVGVSVTTVSKVLNGRADVAEETRARVEASLERHRYRRRGRRSPVPGGQLDLVLHEFDTAWTMEIIAGVEAVRGTAGVDVVLSQLGGEHHPGAAWLEGVLARRPLGIVFALCSPTEEQQEQLRRRRIPFVLVDSDSATSASVPTVGSNNFNGGLLATRHLLELGHRRIAVISGPSDVLCSRARVAGFQFAHEEAGVPVDPALVHYGNFHASAGERIGTQLLAGADRPTAVFAGSDYQAMGVLRAAREAGLSVPRDLSVVGYDNVPMSAWCAPALTTVTQPVRDMAGTAARMLLDLSRGQILTTPRVDLVTELMIRESTAPPR
jgi:LacI family transcriptional regulator